MYAVISGLSSNSEFLHFKLLINRFLYLFSSPIFNFKRLLLELTLSKTFISMNFASIISEVDAGTIFIIKKKKNC